ncbi:class I SAM-dependent methyltransferase [Cellulomonas sp. FA1]|uniref:class I SAM-dependent methyltransferase n=1 Tax=Cellulomonas sp. FA1 TaxID=1346710 RepID=UPI0009E1F569|nr:class I SAM-dependent methyltransferase [Cellulomonas sp. FA1]
MEANDTPSPTALLAAAARAAHALVDEPPLLLEDPAAHALCTTGDTSPLDFQLAQPGVPVLAAARVSACARARHADDVLVARRARQIVVLGAGLDTTPHRRPAPGRRFWLVDLPDVLTWRAQLLARASLPEAGVPVPADLGGAGWFDALVDAGLDPHVPVVAVWLGVGMYLEPDACRALLAALAALPAGSTLVLDHVLPADERDAAGAAYAAAVAAFAGRHGEPWRTAASAATVRDWLTDAGWAVADERDEADAVPPGFWDAQPHLRPMRLVRLVTATLTAPA